MSIVDAVGLGPLVGWVNIVNSKGNTIILNKSTLKSKPSAKTRKWTLFYRNGACSFTKINNKVR